MWVTQHCRSMALPSNVFLIWVTYHIKSTNPVLIFQIILRQQSTCTESSKPTFNVFFLIIIGKQWQYDHLIVYVSLIRRLCNSSIFCKPEMSYQRLINLQKARQNLWLNGNMHFMEGVAELNCFLILYFKGLVFHKPI